MCWPTGLPPPRLTARHCAAGTGPRWAPLPEVWSCPWPGSCHDWVGPVSHHPHGLPPHPLCIDFLSLTPQPTLPSSFLLLNIEPHASSVLLMPTSCSVLRGCGLLKTAALTLLPPPPHLCLIYVALPGLDRAGDFHLST